MAMKKKMQDRVKLGPLQWLFPIVSSALLVGCQSSGTSDALSAPLASSVHLNRTAIVRSASEDERAKYLSPFIAGTYAQHSDDHTGAADYYLKALLLDPKSVFVARRAFYELVFSEKISEAARLAPKLTTTTDSDLAHLIYALDGFDKGDMRLMRDRIDQMPERGFSFLLGPILKAWSFAREGQMQAASDALNGIIDNPRLTVIGLTHLAYIADLLDFPLIAETSYKKILESGQSTSLQPIISYAALLVRADRREEARQLLSDEIEKYPSSSYLLREGARVMSNGGYRDVNSVRQGIGMLFYRLGSEFDQAKDYVSSLIYYNLAAYMMPNMGEISLMQATLLEKMERYVAAADKFASIANIDGSAFLFLRQVNALKQAGQRQEALNLLLQANVDNPGEVSIMEALGDIYREKEEFETAILYYDKVLETRKNSKSDWYTYFSRGIAHEQAGNWNAAEADLLTALKMAPEHPAILNYLGYSWIDRGMRQSEAKAMIEKAVAAQPGNGFVMDSLGWVYYLTGDYDKAVTTLEKAVSLEPEDATISDHLGDAYWQVGRKMEARYIWRQLLEAGGDDEKMLKSVQQKLLSGPQG